MFKFTNQDAFINRKDEFNFLQDWINQKPNNILFIYGPKSSGKTTLLMKFIEMYLNNNQYSIKHFNLRKLLIANYIDFIQAFFEIDYSKSTQDIKQKTEYSLKVFKLSKEIKKCLENKTLDPFIVMEKELLKISKKGKRPIIIIDEMQALEDIYVNGQRELLKELFNFFVAITKESHLCHVIISSSDGYFMKRLYEDSKLSKTSDFYAVDYLNEFDTKYWLNHLESESAITHYTLSDTQIDMIWNYIGGSMWEISTLLGKLIRFSKNNVVSNEQLNSFIQKIIDENCGKFIYYAKLNRQKILLFKEIYHICLKQNEFTVFDLTSLIHNHVYNNIELSEELNQLVQLNYLAFHPTTSIYRLQGKSMFYGLQTFIERLPDDIETMIQ